MLQKPCPLEETAMYAVYAYIAYLFISISVTIWVARTLSRNGRVFLIDTFLHNEPLADAVNNLLVVGFYLINVGYVALALKYGARPTDPAGTIETMSTKVGLVLAGARRHAFLQPVRVLEDAPQGPAAQPEAAGAPRAVRHSGALLERCRVVIIPR